MFKSISLVYGPIIFLVKLSLLLLYYRLFSCNKTMRFLIYFGIAFQALFYIASIGFYSAAEATCTQSSKAQAAFYLREWVFTVVSGIVNVITDFYVLILPIAMVWSLQLTTRRKIGVIAIFSTGLALVCYLRNGISSMLMTDDRATTTSLARLIVSIQRLHDPDSLWTAALVSMMR